VKKREPRVLDNGERYIAISVKSSGAAIGVVGDVWKT
jgi:hypothetical protein